MAYAFDRVLGVMGRQKKDQQPMEMGGGRQAPGASQANPYGRPMEAVSNPMAAQPAAGAAPQRAAGDRVRAATTEGALPQGGGAGAPAAPQAAPQAQQTPASRGRLFQANAGRAQSPVDLSAMGQQIAASKERIKNTANDYVENAGNFYSSDLPNYVSGAIQGFSGLSDVPQGGNMSNYSDIAAGGLGMEGIPPVPGSGNDNRGVWNNINNPVSSASWTEAYTQGPGQVAAFSNPYSTNITNADLLETDAGLGELFRRQGGAEYSAGDAAFDTALLRKNAAFNALRDQTLSQNRDLQKYGIEVGGTATEEAQNALESSYSGWKGAVTGQLEKALKDLEARGGEREGQFDANIMSQREKDKGKAAKYANDAIAKLRKENPQLAEQIKAAAAEGYDPSEYMNVSGLTDDKTAWSDFLAENEAKGFNNVMSILGRGGPAMSKGQYYGANYGDYVNPAFDSAGFSDMILNKAASMPKLEVEKGEVNVPASFNKPTVTPSGPNAPKPPQTPMPGQVAIDTSGTPVDISGAYTPVDPNTVEPVSTYQPGTVALDVESGGESSAGSTTNIYGPGSFLPEWMERTPYNPWPNVNGQMGR